MLRMGRDAGGGQGHPVAALAPCGCCSTSGWSRCCDPIPTRASRKYTRARHAQAMVLAELPAEDRRLSSVPFSTWHWARLLGGSADGSRLLAGAGSRVEIPFPSPASIDLFRRAGATHLTYNCALEKRRDRCAAVVEFLDGSSAMELVADGRWERGDRPSLSPEIGVNQEPAADYVLPVETAIPPRHARQKDFT